MVERKHRVGRVADSHQRIGLEAARAEPFDHAGLGLRRHGAHFPPAIGEEAERSRSRDFWIELAQRARGRVARVGEDLLSRRFLPLVQRQKGGFRHVNLAADFAHIRRVFAAQLLRNVGERSHIRADVFAFGAVAAGCSAHQASAFVAQRAGQAVDLRLGGEDELLICGQT